MSDETQGSKDVNLNVTPIRADLSKAATVFMERMWDLIGGWVEPGQIRRKAQAEADAAIVKATAEIEITDLHRRAMVRFVNEEARQQYNIEEIVAEATPQITDTAKPHDVAEDWITNFLAKCRLVSDEQMRTIWAKVLAGEANTPGSYSKRALTILESFDKKDAELFATLCRFSWNFGGIYNVPVVIDYSNAIYRASRLEFGVLKHLETIGLVSVNELTGFGMPCPYPIAISASYGGQVFQVRKLSTEPQALPVGQVMFTQVGRELSQIVDPEPVAQFGKHVVEYWMRSGFFVNEEAGPFPQMSQAPSVALNVTSNPIPEGNATWM